jgi:hypothetical protein
VASRPSRSKKPKQSAWEIYCLKGARAAFVGRLKGRRRRSSVSSTPRTRGARSRWQSRKQRRTGRSVAAIRATTRMTTRRYPPPFKESIRAPR